MSYFAIINGGLVDNIIVADSIEDATQIAFNSNQNVIAVEINNEPNSPGIGWTYDGTTFEKPILSVE
jgi:hypothetical protein